MAISPRIQARPTAMSRVPLFLQLEPVRVAAKRAWRCDVRARAFYEAIANRLLAYPVNVETLTLTPHGNTNIALHPTQGLAMGG